MPARTSSSGDPGATYPALSGAHPPGSGSRLRSTFPLAFTGSRSSGTTAQGTIASGSRSRR